MVAGVLFAVVRREVKSWADLAAVWEARHLVAKLQVCRRGRRASEVAVRKAAGAEVVGLMAGYRGGMYNLGKANGRESTSSRFPAAVSIAQSGEEIRVDRTAVLAGWSR